MDVSRALLFPAPNGRLPGITLHASADRETEFIGELRASEWPGNFTPDRVLARKTVSLAEVADGSFQPVSLDFDCHLETPQYLFLCCLKTEGVRLRGSESRVTGIMTVKNAANRKVARTAAQEPDPSLGIDSFELWIPERPPGGHNLAVGFAEPLAVFGTEQLSTGFERPFLQANAWVADPDDPEPTLLLKWTEKQTIRRLTIAFDTDHDHAMETVIRDHPERRMPFCVRRAHIEDGEGRVLAKINDNHQTYSRITLETPVVTDRLRIVVEAPPGDIPASLFAVRCHG